MQQRSVDDLPCVDLLAHYVSDHDRAFLYQSAHPGSSVSDAARIGSHQACVSALSYVPGVELLLVGFNFGPFQIWNLASSRQPIFGSTATDGPENPRATLPVTHLMYQQPNPNWPNKAFLWVGRGALPRFIANVAFANPSDSALAVVFELTLALDGDRKQIIRSDLRHCESLSSLATPTTSTSTPSKSQGGSTGRIISCQILASPNFIQGRSTHSSSVTTSSLVNNFAVFFWETLRTARDGSVHANSTEFSCAVFDLKSALDSANFSRWQHYKLNEALPSASPLLDVALDHLTVSQYAGHSFRDLDPEQRRSRRSAPLSFNTLVLSRDALIRVSFLSPQQALLSQFAARGPIAFEKIEQYAAPLAAAGMLSGLQQPGITPGRNELKEAVFDLTLLHDLGSLLCSYPLEPSVSFSSGSAVSTMTEDSASASDSPFLLADPAPLKNWASRRLTSLRAFLEAHSRHLLSAVTVEQQESVEQAITMIHLVLVELTAIFTALQRRLDLQTAQMLRDGVSADMAPRTQLSEFIETVGA